MGQIGNAGTAWNTKSENLMFTQEGGLAIRMINKTGAASIKGSVVELEGTTDKGVELSGIGSPDPIGIIYDSGIADGDFVWVVVSGFAEVLYSTAVTRGTFARVPDSGDTSGTAGQAIAEPLPSPPFASDKHFQEIGHPAESIGSPGLALTVLHFN